MDFRTLIAVLLISDIRTIHSGWIATNLSHFCDRANDCIISQAQSVMDISESDTSGSSRNAACNHHKNFCINSWPRPTKVHMKQDKEKFCQSIMSCHKGHIITGPIVDIAHWCPYSSFCNNASTKHPPKDHAHSCCMPCSCEPSCRVNHNCCFQTNYTDNTLKLETSTCIKVDSDYIDMPNNTEVGFYMKTTCPNGTQCPNRRDRQQFATSNEKQLIYTSEECGQCNGADDAEAWTVRMQCRFDRSGSCTTIIAPKKTEYRDWIEQKTDMYDWMLQYLCSDSVIRTCHPQYKHTAVIQACHETNALVMTKRSDVVIFANIFCVACNFVLPFYPTERCNVLYSRKGQREKDGTPRMKILLDMETQLNAMKERVPTTVVQHGSYCTGHTVKHIGQPGCRFVYCATGMVLMKDDVCKYSAKKWFHTHLALQISLHPTNISSLPASLLRNISREFHISTWMISPCVSWTDEYAVYMHSIPLLQGRYVTEVVIVITVYKDESLPSEIIADLARCFDAQWKVVTDGKQYDFYPSFFTGIDPLPITTHSWYNDEKYEHIYSLLSKTANLHKLYFCDQVELQLDEYEVFKDKRFLLLHNNLTLGINEVNSLNTGLRVCVEDYLRGYSDFSGNTAVAMCSSLSVLGLLVIQCIIHACVML